MKIRCKDPKCRSWQHHHAAFQLRMTFDVKPGLSPKKVDTDEVKGPVDNTWTNGVPEDPDVDFICCVDCRGPVEILEDR